MRTAALLAVVLGALGLWATDAPAAAPAAFVAGATASGVRLTYTVPTFLVLEEFVDAGGPIAQSQLATGDVSRAFASNPFPGATAVGAPGVVAFGTGLPAPPDYPLFVSADYPFKPHQESQDPVGVYKLDATAAAKESSALAAAGPEQAGTFGRTNVKLAANGVVTSVAETVVHGISLGEGVLEIASVKSRSVTTLARGASKPKTVTELVIEGASVMGTPVGFNSKGLQIASSGVPVAAAEQLAPLNAALRDAGLNVKVVHVGAIDNGAAADALEITSVNRLPVPGGPTGTAIYRFGGATSYIGVGAAAVDAAPGLLPSGGPTAEDVNGSASAPSPLAASSGSPNGDAASPQGGSSRASTEAVRRALAPAADVRPGALARDLRKTVRWLYVVFIVGGVLFMVAASLWHSKGVQVPWTASSPG